MSNEMLGPGYGVTVLGRSGMRYREGTATVFVDGEMRNGAEVFAIYRSSIRAWEGSGAAIDDAERQRIIDHISVAFQQNGVAVTVE